MESNCRQWDIMGRDTPKRTLDLVPWPDSPNPWRMELWRYRRIVNRAIYREDAAEPPPAVRGHVL